MSASGKCRPLVLPVVLLFLLLFVLMEGLTAGVGEQRVVVDKRGAKEYIQELPISTKALKRKKVMASTEKKMMVRKTLDLKRREQSPLMTTRSEMGKGGVQAQRRILNTGKDEVGKMNTDSPGVVAKKILVVSATSGRARVIVPRRKRRKRTKREYNHLEVEGRGKEEEEEWGEIHMEAEERESGKRIKRDAVGNADETKERTKRNANKDDVEEGRMTKAGEKDVNNEDVKVDREARKKLVIHEDIDKIIIKDKDKTKDEEEKGERKKNRRRNRNRKRGRRGKGRRRKNRRRNNNRKKEDKRGKKRDKGGKKRDKGGKKRGKRHAVMIGNEERPLSIQELEAITENECSVAYLTFDEVSAGYYGSNIDCLVSLWFSGQFPHWLETPDFVGALRRAGAMALSEFTPRVCQCGIADISRQCPKEVLLAVLTIINGCPQRRRVVTDVVRKGRSSGHDDEGEMRDEHDNDDDEMRWTNVGPDQREVNRRGVNQGEWMLSAQVKPSTGIRDVRGLEESWRHLEPFEGREERRVEESWRHMEPRGVEENGREEEENWKSTYLEPGYGREEREMEEYWRHAEPDYGREERGMEEYRRRVEPDYGREERGMETSWGREEERGMEEDGEPERELIPDEASDEIRDLDFDESVTKEMTDDESEATGEMRGNEEGDGVDDGERVTDEGKGGVVDGEKEVGEGEVEEREIDEGDDGGEKMGEGEDGEKEIDEGEDEVTDEERERDDGNEMENGEKETGEREDEVADGEKEKDEGEGGEETDEREDKVEDGEKETEEEEEGMTDVEKEVKDGEEETEDGEKETGGGDRETEEAEDGEVEGKEEINKGKDEIGGEKEEKIGKEGDEERD